MTNIDSLFPDFEARWIDGPVGKIFARVGGKGPPVVLIHGFPQTHAEWHEMAGELAKTHTVVCPDLRGYGWSAAPHGDGGKALYTKRGMGEDIVAAMSALGFNRFAVIGHDRGARVAYRLALDHLGRVERLVLLDILPTVSMWEGMNAARAMQVYHWTFLAQPEPVPEKLIQADPAGWLDHTIASWTRAKKIDAFHPLAMAAYADSFNDPSRIHAACEDYRAGATTDLDYDKADLGAGKKILCPVLVLWGEAGIPAKGASPLEIWRETFAPQAEGQAIASGHFLPEENPQDTLAAVKPFLAREVA
ncbi:MULTISPECIES: alpha/beta hydrolase [unclassified Bosea (in: a-proteobacteria)]|uniref:alpha/beta fold hydrolase n=1 Tax=unclassified Bosea (in: a-proteobacteria) TaxID=2653178 RepID=UPI000F75E361|nr:MULTISPECIES: alpha/beta hydrolase [unclassified Bosea (in: a-proteobacteria)]AZO78791.1 alpha/beta hydrolase [Bosea sp. Tri-49]RXT17421.1 alpha/beta hydrolase [Bosea sp. Tri-39]RXT40793.1 alpha/beta hydrolase [Bosea sp. Tri-54]